MVTATKTRKKQQTDAIRQAIRQKEDKQREERHSFLITTNPITQQAAHERLDHGPGEDHAESKKIHNFKYLDNLLMLCIFFFSGRRGWC